MLWHPSEFVMKLEFGNAGDLYGKTQFKRTFNYIRVLRAASWR